MSFVGVLLKQQKTTHAWVCCWSSIECKTHLSQYCHMSRTQQGALQSIKNAMGSWIALTSIKGKCACHQSQSQQDMQIVVSKVLLFHIAAAWLRQSQPCRPNFACAGKSVPQSATKRSFVMWWRVLAKVCIKAKSFHGVGMACHSQDKGKEHLT